MSRSETADRLIGRDRELAAVASFIDGLGGGMLALVIAGEPGIGKTALWEAGVARARDQSHTVLVARPSDAEAQLSFLGLSDLLADVLDETLEALPRPQRRALAAALLLDDPVEAIPEERAISLALLGVLRMLAERHPVVVAVDDLHWLDRPTSAVLTYAMRRLRGASVALLVTARREEPPRPVPIVDGGLDPPQVSHLDLGPLSAGALHRLLVTRLGLALSRPLLIRLHDVTGGNPFYALELARGLEPTRYEPGAAWAIPPSLQELASARIEKLPPRTRDVLATVSALGQPDLATLSAAVSSRTGVQARLREAAAAGLVAVDGERVRFTHPLLASAAYSSAEVPRRRRIHRRIAAVVDDSEQRAWHIALGTEHADDLVAAAVDDGASHAAGRGAASAAAELQELATRLTPVGAEPERRRRMTAAARYHLAAGELHRARVLLELLVDELPPGGERVDVLVLLLDAVEEDSNVVQLSERALAEAGDDARRASRVHAFLGRYWTTRGENTRALASARAALALAEQSEDGESLLAAATHLARAEIRAAERTPGVLERALALEASAGHRVLDSPRLALAHLRLFQGRLSEARSLCEAVLLDAVARGDETSTEGLHGILGYVECSAGRWARAAEHSQRACEIASQVFGSDSVTMAQDITLDAHIAAHLGRLDDAVSAAEHAAAIADQAGAELIANRSRAVIGFVELTRGNVAAAVAVLTPVIEHLIAHGFAVAPHPLSIEPLEALIATGNLERARPLVERYLTEAQAIESPLLRAAGQRCLGLIAARDGDLTAARELFSGAISSERHGESPFELARTLLASGSTERRAKQKRPARERLIAAFTIFDGLGARPWADQAQSELGRIGGRPPSSGGLTPAEQRVASLIASGRTNSEAAAELYLSEHTVEGHLSHIYAKLGLRSRSELARRYAADQTGAPADR